jgi:hypothetical protein
MEMAERHIAAASNRSSSLAELTSLVVGCPTLLVQAVQFTKDPASGALLGSAPSWKGHRKPVEARINKGAHYAPPID